MKDFFKQISTYYSQHPFKTILWVALLVRLIAAIFSRGYLMMDDHYLVIEQSQQWVDHYDEDMWLPQYGAISPSGHSLFYVGLHYILFFLLQSVGIINAQIKILIVRIIHALWSMGIVYWGFLITKKLSNQRYAQSVAWILSLLWLFPMLSVHQLVEFACIPFILWSIWLIVKEEKTSIARLIWAGFIGGLAISVRFQTALIIGGIAMALLLNKKWKAFVFYSLGAVASFVLLQGVTDIIIWHRPFAEFSEYVRYNLENRYNYFRGNWYNYLLLIMGLLVPPASFMLLWGWIKTYRKYLILFLPALLFLLFHTYFPNRQERFILPILPLLIIQGTMGWLEFKEKSKFCYSKARMFRGFVIFSIVINFILLIPLTVMYSKRSYVEAMIYLKDKPFHNLFIDDKNHDAAPIIPRFYLQRWCHYFYVSGKNSVNRYIILNEKHPLALPEYVLFFEKENLPQRLDSIKLIYPHLVKDTVIYPGMVDKVMHFLNKHNKNQTIIIYRYEK